MPLEDSEKHEVEYEVSFDFDHQVCSLWCVVDSVVFEVVIEVCALVSIQVHRLVVNRDPKFTKFVEVSNSLLPFRVSISMMRQSCLKSKVEFLLFSIIKCTKYQWVSFINSVILL